MLKIRVAEKSDAPLLTANNCAMALETENRVLDPQAAKLGVEGLFA